MSGVRVFRREFLKLAGIVAGTGLVGPTELASLAGAQEGKSTANYTLHIAASPIEIAPNRIVSGIVYNGQFPGPLLRFKEGRQLRWIFSTTLIRRSSCTGTGSSSRSGCRRCGGRGHAVHSSAWREADHIYAAPVGISVLSHAQSSGSKSGGGTVWRPSWASLYRAGERTGQV